MRVVEKFVSINGEGLRSGELAVFNWWRTIDSKRNKRTNDRTIKYWKQN